MAVLAFLAVMLSTSTYSLSCVWVRSKFSGKKRLQSDVHQWEEGLQLYLSRPALMQFQSFCWFILGSHNIRIKEHSHKNENCMHKCSEAIWKHCVNSPKSIKSHYSLIILYSHEVYVLCLFLSRTTCYDYHRMITKSMFNLIITSNWNNFLKNKFCFQHNRGGE